MACEMHQELYKDLPKEVIEMMEKYLSELTKLAELVGTDLGPFLMAKFGRFNEITGEPENIPDDEVPQHLLNTRKYASILYLAGFHAAGASKSNEMDQVLYMAAVNGINDGNTYYCVNASEGNTH